MSTDPLNIAALALAHAGTSRGAQTALRFAAPDGDQTLTYDALAARTRRVAGGLIRRGVSRGDRVLVQLASGPDYAASVLATLAVGAVVVPSTTALTDAEAAFVFDDAEATLWLRESARVDLPDRAFPIVAPDDLADAAPITRCATTGPNDPAILIYTSGTTRRPKGVLHGHRMARGRWPMRDGWTGLRADDVLLHAGKLNWTYTLGLVLIDVLETGATAVLWSGDNDPTVWPRLAARSRATLFAAVPSVYRQILKYDDGLREAFASLRHGLCAGEPLRPELLDAWRAEVGCELYEALGMSECSTYVSAGPTTPVRAGSPGRPQPGRRVAVLPVEGGDAPLPSGEIGLLAVHRSDPGLMLGYWKRPDEEAEVWRGDWFVGGDLARIDADGYVWFEGRANELMNAFGYRVSPLEVEATVMELPGVAACAVAERSVRDDVDVICAYVVRGDRGCGAPTRDEVLAHCASKLARYKCPREVVFVDALPVGRNGKLQRRALAALG